MTDPTSTASPPVDHAEPADAPKGPRRRRRGARIAGWLAVGVVGTIALFFLLRNLVLNSVLDSELTRLTGGEVSLRGVSFEGLSKVRIDAVEINAPDWSGPSANVLMISGIEATLDPFAVFGSGPSLSSLVADTVRLRIAERYDDPTDINLLSLKPKESDPDDSSSDRVASFPFGSIQIRDLEIETGTADGDDFERHGLSRFQATIDPVPDEPSIRTFFLASIDDDIDQIDLAKGTWNASTGRLELRIDDVDLERGTNLALPSAARSIIEAMQISGSVRTAMIEWTPGETPRAELSIDDLSLIPPRLADLDDAWVSYEGGRITGTLEHLPRIDLQHGTIKMDGDVLEVRGDGGSFSTISEGVVVPDVELDATLRVRLSDGPESTRDLATWGESLLSSAPFEATVRVVRFDHSDDDRGQAMELPRLVGEALELLRAESWEITATARATRGSLYGEQDSQDDTIDVRADLDIRRGRGMYKDFEYPLHDVVANLSIENDLIRVDSLRGLGPANDEVQLHGNIIGTSDDAGVDLFLSSDSIRLDDALLNALPPATEKGLRTLFDQTAATRLAESGLLPDPPFYESLPQRIAEDENRLLEARGRGEDLEAEALLDRIRASRIMLRNGPFEVGGRGAIDLRIHRPKILGHPVAVEGSIQLFQVGAIFSRFPYPLVITSGELILEDLAVRLDPPGLGVTTLFGGEGQVSGRVDLPRDGQGSRDVEPSLSLHIDGDRLDDCLLAAVPPALEGRPSPESIPGWPGTLYSPAVESVRAMGLAGTLDYTVDISTDAEGDARFEVVGQLRDGTADPNEATESEVAAAGLLWPRDFVLSDVRATLRVDDEHVSLDAFSGHRGPGIVTAQGIYDFETEVGRGIARLRNLEVESYLLDLVPAGTIEDAKRLWARWQPTGRFNADLHLNRREGRTDLRLEAEPLWASFDTEVGRTRIDCQRGRLKFGDDVIDVVDLALALGGPDASDGALRLSGRYGLAPKDGELVLDGILDAGRFEAPAVDELLRLVTGDDFSNWWRTRAPRGGFTGTFEIHSGGELDVDLDLIPSSFSMLSREGDPESRCGGNVVNDGRVTVADRRVQVGPIELLSDDDARSNFDIVLPDVDTPDLFANFTLELPSSELPETGFLPPPFSSLFGEDGLVATNIVARGGLRATFRNAAQRAAADAPTDPTIPSFYLADGDIDFEDGRWTIGGVELEFEPDDDGLVMGLEATNGVPTMFDLSGSIPKTLVAGRPVLDTTLSGHLDPRSNAASPWLLIDASRGSIGGGDVKVESGLEFGTTRYRTRLIVNDVDLDSIARTSEDELRESGERLPGILSARVDLGGLTDDPDSRVGRGKIMIRDAVLADSGSLALLQIGQLVPPMADELAVARANFWINRGMLDIDDITLEAETLTLAGQGEMRLDDWQWSIRLLPRGPVPALSDLVSAISGTLAAIDVTGTPNDPQVNLTPLPLVVPRSSFERIATPNQSEDSEQEQRP